MLSDEVTTGAIRTTDGTKRNWARRSWTENLRNPTFTSMFADYFE
jgi:hypothetical protein